VSHQRKLQGFKLWLLCNACDMQLAKCSNSRYGQNDYRQSVAHACLIKIIAQCLLLGMYFALWVNLNIHSTLISAKECLPWSDSISMFLAFIIWLTDSYSVNTKMHF